MLDADIKQRIDNARQVLVGKIPDPKGQVEFITVALIYKFLSEADRRGEEGGGKRAFFTGRHARFYWGALMDARKSGKERMELYDEALKRIPEHPAVPESFRAIFGGAALPFRDPRTLNLFLAEIDGIPYKRAEDMGTPYEYLLNIMGANRGAGQFRTPQHIIDFIVAAANPQKEESVCDPACGTAGFLISAHRHIMRANGKQRPGDQLTPGEKRNLAKNWRGYDIDPGMTRLALANAFMHGIRREGLAHVYDSLTNSDHWNEKYDVIMANPPFMTPRGGIQPHKLFAVRANRAEVLFVDYIGEHLAPGGRAGVVVPEGVVFQSGKAYKQLRKYLVEEWGLSAVVSLPAGVFLPYSGVKTSILLLDKKTAKRPDILFVNVAHDGFDLGAQRRPIEQNDLPQALKMLRQWRKSPTVASSAFAYTVAKEAIAADDGYNLTGDLYHKTVMTNSGKWKTVRLDEICRADKRAIAYGGNQWKKLQYIGLENIASQTGTIINSSERKPQGVSFYFCNRHILFSKLRPYLNKVALPDFEGMCSTEAIPLLPNPERVDRTYLALLLRRRHVASELMLHSSGTRQPRAQMHRLFSMKIPLPPLEVQREIVAEIDGWQKIIDGAQQAADNWRPQIIPSPDWKTVSLTDICQITGIRPPKFKGEKSYYDTRAVGVNGVEEKPATVTYQNRPSRADCYPPLNAVGFAKMKGTQKTVFIDDSLAGAVFSTGFQFLAPEEGRINPRFLFALVRSDFFQRQKDKMAPDGIMGSIALKSVAKLTIPLPPLKIQQKIAAELDAEEQAITACRSLITAHQHKISSKINEIWGSPGS